MQSGFAAFSTSSADGGREAGAGSRDAVWVPRAVLFDLDGTLYRQRPLRLRMLPPLLAAGIADGGRTIRALATFRRVREELRALGAPAQNLERLQYTAAAERVGCDASWLEAIVRDWMFERPLRFLRACRRAGIVELLDALAARGIVTGVFSDYPTTRKLDALGLGGRFALELCATDERINAFKPHPRGFLAAAEHWRLAPADILYIGDRASVDSAGARAAGMRDALVDSHGFARIAREIAAHD